VSVETALRGGLITWRRSQVRANSNLDQGMSGPVVGLKVLTEVIGEVIQGMRPCRAAGRPKPAGL